MASSRLLSLRSALLAVLDNRNGQLDVPGGGGEPHPLGGRGREGLRMYFPICLLNSNVGFGRRPWASRPPEEEYHPDYIGETFD